MTELPTPRARPYRTEGEPTVTACGRPAALPAPKHVAGDG